MSEIEVLASEVLSEDWGRLTKYTYELVRRDGSRQTMTREAYDRGNGATCLLYNPATGCVLLTRQFRLPVWLNERDPDLIETPAGLLEGAHPEERMREELIEETGFEVSGLEHLYDVFMSPGSVTEYLAFFAGTYSIRDQVSDGGGKHEEGEDIAVMHVPLDEALAMIDSGEICDAKTIILLQRLALEKLRGK